MRKNYFFFLVFGMTLGVLGADFIATAVGQDKPVAEEGDKSEKDPFEVPDGEPAELLDFMKKVVRIQPKSREMAVTREHVERMQMAIAKAASKVLENNNTTETQRLEAVRSKLSALDLLSRINPAKRRDLEEFSKSLENEPNPEIQAIAGSIRIQAMAMSLMSASADEVQSQSENLFAYLEKFGLNRTSVMAAESFARATSRHPEIGASIYERLGSLYEKSDDEKIRERAERMIGSARRMRLMGKPMEVKGVVEDGTPFDWESYRGKVVLVDFWASWCGPCLAELPNMKRNLERYGEKGFAIVGINMDDNFDAYKKCVADKEISWVNLVSREEGKTGWNTPIATYYGITGIPTAILIDQKGNVVNLSARGKKLDESLEELLGKVDSEKVGSDSK